MRVVIQRVKSAQVIVEEQLVGQIQKGLLLLVGVTHNDTEENAVFVAEKIANLRIFEDNQGKMNISVIDTGGAILSVSQFTLYGDCTKGRRPNFMNAAKPDDAEKIYEKLNTELRSRGLVVETGKFGAMMDVQLINDGPVTLIVEK